MLVKTLRLALYGALLTLVANPAWAQPAKPKDTPPREPLTAETLAQWVVDTNPGLAAARAAAEAAAYRIEPAGSLDDPMLSYGVAPLTADADRSLNQRVDVSQKIPWPGTLDARESAARYDAAAVDRDVDALRLFVTAQAKAAYAEWRFVDQALAINRETQALLDDLVAVAETRYAAGRALKQDVLQAEVERTSLDNQELRLLQQQSTVKARINALLNRAPEAALPDAAPIRLRPEPPTLADLQDIALAQHPDLARLNARISANQSRVTLARKAFYPDFQIGVGYNSLWDNVDKRPVFGVSINIPLYRDKRRSDLDRALADTRRATLALTERRADLLADLAEARAQVVEMQDSVTLYADRLVPLAGEYLDAAVADYQSGAGAFLNVITAEQRKLNTDLAHARARADYERRYAELERWTGGPVHPSRPAPAGVTQ